RRSAPCCSKRQTAVPFDAKLSSSHRLPDPERPDTTPDRADYTLRRARCHERGQRVAGRRRPGRGGDGDQYLGQRSPAGRLSDGGAPELLEEENPVRRDGVFLEPFPRPPELFIFGGSHVAIPLTRLADILGFRVTVVDARSKFADRERFPEARQVIHAWPDE